MKKLALLSLAVLMILTMASVTPAAAEDLPAVKSNDAPMTPAQTDLDKLLSNPSRIEAVCFWIPTGDCCPTNAFKMIEENSCTGALRCGFRDC